MFHWLIGWWLFLDSLISVLYYIRRPNETWKKNHSLRLIRGAMSLALIAKGYKDIREE